MSPIIFNFAVFWCGLVRFRKTWFWIKIDTLITFDTCYKGKRLSCAYFGILIGCDCDFDLLHNVMGSSRAHATSFYQVS